MPAYTIIYKSERDESILKETVFMKNLGAAKRSSMSNAPLITHKVEIYDLMEKCLSRREGGKAWKNL
ncbi:hypothetical protein J7Y46_004674 [Vibrio parahaemolyticus]|nr:hypothetical protein [Vibrio parahaemolyticus]